MCVSFVFVIYMSAAPGGGCRVSGKQTETYGSGFKRATRTKVM